MEDEEGGHRGLVVVSGQTGRCWQNNRWVRDSQEDHKETWLTDVEVREDDVAHAVDGLRRSVCIVISNRRLQKLSVTLL